MMRPDLTAEQRQAVTTIERSVVVSAGAGSGKTAVLAARCIHLIADASPPFLCDVDRLLVLTFTEAAAAEMRLRIVSSLHERAACRPDDDRLRNQTLLVNGAQISTIHAFCLWICRRWFSELGIDPHAPLLDDEEARVLRRAVLDELFEQLYDPQRDPLALLTGDNTTAPATPNGDDARRAAFARLIDDYGLGKDRDIARIVLALHGYASSLPDPGAWFRAARGAVGDHADQTLVALAITLRDELRRQIEHVQRVQRRMSALPPLVHPYLVLLQVYLDSLREWSQTLSTACPIEGAGDSAGRPSPSAALDAFDRTCAAIAGFEYPKAPTVRLGKDASDDVRATKEMAKEWLDQVRDQLFRHDLRDGYAVFTVAQWRAGLSRVAPYVDTLIELVERYGQAYDRRKRQLDVLDFGDLERLALQLLCTDGDASQPSDIARNLRQRFAQVLVNEFQDINPIQRAIVQLVSREDEPQSRGNLFVVGDVKQSIYRFRLGEPEIFVERWEAFRGSDDGAGALTLRKNFRSSREIIDAVNRVFRELMRPGRGSIPYDELAELRHGRAEDGTSGLPVELHLIERRPAPPDDPHAAAASDNREERSAGLNDPARWNAAEREAYIIGKRIRQMIDAPTVKPNGEALRYRDCVVLLRAARVAAEQMVRVLHALGVPAHADAGASLFDAREVRDVLAALRVLDNRRQDIPLAAILRSGIFGESLSADELVAVRSLQSDARFHECVLEYAERGADAALRDRLAQLLARIESHRHHIRCRPVAEALGDSYERYGFLSYVCGLPDGLQRRANLFKLHELAGRFGGFRRQGLHRFLMFLESLQEQERDLASASPLGPAEDVVRVMTIHQSKGLEFPVVFVAGLGNRFNFRDRAGRMIFERSAHIGLRVVDPVRRVEYASAAHRLVVEETQRRAREEEMRILYVAMTRAREQLILVGSRAYLGQSAQRWADALDCERLDTWETLHAGSALDWVAPVLMAGADVQKLGQGVYATGDAGVRVAWHSAEQIGRWSVEATADAPSAATLAAVANFAPLPMDAPRATDDPEVNAIMQRLDFTYRALALTAVPAVMGASALKSGEQDSTNWDAPIETPLRESRAAAAVNLWAKSNADEAIRRGMVMHRVLEHLDFGRARDDAGVRDDVQRLVDAGLLAADDCSLVDAAALIWFIQTPLAQSIRAVGAAYRREFSFMTREAPDRYDPTVGPALDAEDYVLVRGVVDGILPGADAVEIVDYKTDRISLSAVAARVADYRPQMMQYARAVERLWKKPVARVWLVFLGPRQVVELCGTGL